MSNRKELEEYYENFFDLFQHPGWEQFMGQIHSELENHRNNVFNLSADDFETVKGQATVLNRIANLPLMVEQGYNSLEDEDEAL